MRVKNFSDKELITAFLSGDSLSIERLIVRHKDECSRWYYFFKELISCRGSFYC